MTMCLGLLFNGAGFAVLVNKFNRHDMTSNAIRWGDHGERGCKEGETVEGTFVSDEAGRSCCGGSLSVGRLLPLTKYPQRSNQGTRLFIQVRSLEFYQQTEARMRASRAMRGWVLVISSLSSLANTTANLASRGRPSKHSESTCMEHAWERGQGERCHP